MAQSERSPVYSTYKNSTSDKAVTDTLLQRAGALLYSMATMDSAHILSRQALQRCLRTGYAKGVAQSYMIIAYYFNAAGSGDSSLHYYQRALAIANEHQYRKLQEILYLNVGNIYQAQAQYEEALPYYYKSIELTEQSFDVAHPAAAAYALVVSYNNIAGILQKLYDFDQALLYLNKAAFIAKALHAKDLLPNILFAKASVLADLEKIDAAENLCNEAEALAAEDGQKDLMQCLYLLRGDLLLKRGDTQNAVRFYKKLNPDNLVSLDKMQALFSLGKVHFYLKNFAQAEDYFAQAQLLAQHYGARQTMAETYRLLAEMHKQTGNNNSAVHYYHLYTQLKDSLNNESNKRIIYTLERKYQSAEKDRKMAQNDLLIARQQESMKTKNAWMLALVTSGIITLGFIGRYNVKKKKLYRREIELLQQQKKMQSLLAVAKGQEKERKRIARELHDGIGGMLSVLKLYFSNVQKKQPDLYRFGEYGDAMDLLDQTLREVRQTAHNLMPEILLEHGLPEAVRIYCNSLGRTKDIFIQFQCYGAIGRLKPDFELYVYRMIQELIQNILKHAKAGSALVQLSMQEQVFQITVEDDGEGMKNNYEKGMGLSSVSGRVKELGGTISIHSASGKGTSVNIEFDLQKDKKFTEEDILYEM